MGPHFQVNPRVSTQGLTISEPRVTYLGENALVVWNMNVPVGPPRDFEWWTGAQLFSTSAERLGEEHVFFEVFSDLAALPEQKFAMYSLSESFDPPGRYLYVIDDNYEFVGEPEFINGLIGIGAPDIVSNSTGNIFGSWSEGGGHVMARLFDANQLPAGDPLMLDAQFGNSVSNSLSALSDSLDAVVVWMQFDEATRDLDVIARRLTDNPVEGDVNGDFVVDLLDFNLLRDHFAQAAFPFEGDLDGTGFVDLRDFAILKANFANGMAAGAGTVDRRDRNFAATDAALERMAQLLKENESKAGVNFQVVDGNIGFTE